MAARAICGKADVAEIRTFGSDELEDRAQENHGSDDHAEQQRHTH